MLFTVLRTANRELRTANSLQYETKNNKKTLDCDFFCRHSSNGSVYHFAGSTIIRLMRILRKYQLDIIFLFFALLIIIGLVFFGLSSFGEDPHNFEWYTAGPLIVLYFAYVWEIRNKINISERRGMTGKTLVYWIALGITLFISFDSPIPAREYLTIDILFIIFTLLLADSYWDFKKISLKSFYQEK